jgi:hypothetical protein
MKLKKLHLALMAAGTVFCNIASAQLFIDQATFTIQSGATVTVQGDVTSNVDIQGAGKVILKGTANQNVNMNGFSIPILEIDNAANVTLTGNAKVGTSLQFTNGKILLSANNLTLAAAATTTGGGTSKFVETNGTGQLLKELTANATAFEMPVGAGTAYRPAFVTTSGTYASANVGVRVLGGSHPNKPTSISDYIASYWPITRTGITGTVTVAGQYIDAADVTGTEANLRGYFYNGSEWSSASGTNDAALNRVGVPVAANGTVYGMDKFVYIKAKAFLQGAFNTTTGVMSDALRTPTNLIPLTDPYRTSPYSTSFTHVNNNVTETAVGTVFADQASTDNNIVDWVFLELRNNTVSPGNTVLQTRSALITRVGNIVDIDGVSPVTFNNTVNGNYTIAIRHRNHLGISADPSTNLYAAAELKSTAPTIDLTTATDAQIFGTSTAFAVAGGKNLLWSGNSNVNTNIRWNPPSSDKDNILANALILNGVASTVLNNVYNAGDINMDRRVRWNPPLSDKDVILSTSLSATASTVRTQALPN